MKIKMIKQTLGFIIIYSLFIYLFLSQTSDTFETLTYNHGLTGNQWDLLQLILGYYTPKSEQGISYLELKDIKQLIMPICIQLLGILYSVRFLQIPLSFHTFLKTRIQNNKEYFLFFLKKSILYAVIFVCLLGFSLITTLHLSPLDLTHSSFNYQSGSIYWTLVSYLINLLLMILTFNFFIFHGYIKNKSVLSLSFSFLFLILLNIADRVIPQVNLVLFDKTNHFMDSCLFWGLLLICSYLLSNKQNLYQEEYND
ncbi:hypothetical protein IGI37_000326 [Enterococcus sp. AZ194]|uniref:hypothetical protein n=1 Tax=Enterococcus sp. AZ194 TaxID=2774629 RepID=UPI003F27F53C